MREENEINLPPNKAFEKKIQDTFLDGLYKGRGFEIVERIPPGTFGEYDVTLERKGVRMRMEEKIIRHVWDRIAVELIEDIDSGKMGWFFKVNADYLIYCFCENEVPQMVLSIKWPEFKRWYGDNCESYTFIDKDGQVKSAIKINREGWGVSMIHLIPIEAIPDDIKKIIYTKQ